MMADVTSAPSPSTSHGTANIYLVDDDIDVRRSLSFFLHTLGHQVHTYAGGSEFLAALPDLRAGSVLLDIRMPGLDGFDVLKRLDTKVQQFPVIVMTGHGDVRSAVAAMRLGAFDFMEKPFDEAMLLRSIDESMARLAANRDVAEQRRQAEIAIGSLSGRETDVLRALLAGMPNKSMASRFGLSVRTVEMHRANMMEKLRAKSLSHVLRLAASVGLEPLEDDLRQAPRRTF